MLCNRLIITILNAVEKDYTLSFKLLIVSEIEQGHLSVTRAKK